MLTKERLDKLRTRLEDQRKTLQAEIAEESATPDNGMGYSTHPADDGTLAFDQAADLALHENARRLLYQVDRALFRMEEGTYGLCRNCGQPIDYARLKAIPYTRYCLDCASRNEE